MTREATAVRSLGAAAREQPLLATAREHAAAKTQSSQKFKEKEKHCTISIVEIGEIGKKKKIERFLECLAMGPGRRSQKVQGMGWKVSSRQGWEWSRGEPWTEPLGCLRGLRGLFTDRVGMVPELAERLRAYQKEGGCDEGEVS